MNYYVNYTDGKYNDYAVQDYLEGVKDNVARLGALGLEVHYSEVTIGCNDDVYDDDAKPGYCEDRWTEYMSATQAYLYKGLLEICLNEPMCTVFQLWGAVDGWTGAYTGEGSYPFDTNYRPKESWHAMMDAMEGTDHWMNVWEAKKGTGTADDDEEDSSGGGSSDDGDLSEDEIGFIAGAVGAASLAFAVAMNRRKISKSFDHAFGLSKASKERRAADARERTESELDRIARLEKFELEVSRRRPNALS